MVQYLGILIPFIILSLSIAFGAGKIAQRLKGVEDKQNITNGHVAAAVTTASAATIALTETLSPIAKDLTQARIDIAVIKSRLKIEERG